MPKRYFIGFSKRAKTLIIEAVKDKDYLSCELYDYYGQYEVTKQYLKANRYKILEILKKDRPQVYGDLEHAVVS